jgi:cytoskeleton protein RodZ
MLRQARLDLRLTPEDVAKTLRLAPRQIEALENDDYASLPGPTYVRGYLRGYAQFLGLAPDGVVELYNKQQPAAPQVDLTKLSPEPQIDSEHHLIRFSTLGVVVIVFGLAIAWWLGRDDSASRVKPTPIGQLATANHEPTLPPETREGVAAEKDGVMPEIKPAETTTTPVAPVAKPVAPAPTAPTKPAAELKPEPARAVAETKPQPPVATPAPVAPVAIAGPRLRMVLVVTQDSWVDIRDAQQSKLLYEMVRAGRTVTVEGAAPVNVFLGNVDGVTLEVNGKPFDALAHKRGPIARFTVSEPAEGEHAVR